MSDDQFTRLFKYIQAEFAAMHKEFAKVTGRIDTLHGAIDALQRQSETYEQERLITNHQLDRHMSWIKQLATHTKAQLTPEP